MKINGADITIKLLELHGIEVISGVPGGFNLPLYNALYHSKIQHILTRHEQGAGFIAQGMARSSGKPAVCFATSGPGVTNLLTAIADAKLDSVPIIAITGQVPLAAIGTDSFQEIDTYGLTIPITKHNFLVRSAMELLDVIPESFRIAVEGRPGPVVVDIPKNVQQEVVEFDVENEQELYQMLSGYISEDCIVIDNIETNDILLIANRINEAKKPVLYIGGGIVSANAREELYAIAARNNIPVVTTLMGLGCYPPGDSLYLGMLGMHGYKYTNLMMQQADLLIALGVRLDDRAIGNAVKFCPNAEIIHVDIDESEINKVKEASMSISGDVKHFLSRLLPYVEENPRFEWQRYMNEMKASHPFTYRKNADADADHPIEYILKISDIVGPDAIITTDVGQHQMWTAQSYPVQTPRKFLTSGGLGTMGFGLPAAIGAAVQNPDTRVVSISGDGSLLMNIQELATLADLGLNVTVVVMNNGHLGLVRQQQELFYGENYIASKFIKPVDYAKIAEGFGIRSYDIEGAHNAEQLLREALTGKGPSLINIPIHFSENVFPIVPPGKSNAEMIGGNLDD